MATAPFLFPATAPASGFFPAPPAFPYAPTPSPSIHDDPHLTSHLSPLIHAPPPPLYYPFPMPVSYPTAPPVFPPPPFPFSSAATYHYPPDQGPHGPLATHLSSPTLRRFDTIPAARNREPRPSQSHAPSTSSVPTSTSHADPSYSTAACVPVANEPPRAMTPPTPTSIPCDRTEEDDGVLPRDDCVFQMEKSAFHPAMPDSIYQGDVLTKDNGTGSEPIYTTTAPSLGISLSPATTASTPGFTQSSGSTAIMSTSSSPFSSALLMFSVAPASVVPQVFDEMPQQYDFHNLSRKTVFRADGSGHSYYVLPEDYPLEKTLPEPVFDITDDDTDGSSNEFIDVFVGTSEQKPHEDTESSESLEELVSEQLPKYSSKASENVIPSRQPPMSATPTDQMQFQAFESMPNYDVYEKEDSACLKIISDVRDFTLELQQQEDKRAWNYSVLKAYKWTMSLTEEGRERWDPGILKTIMVVSPVVKWSSLILVILPRSMLWDSGASSSLHSSKGSAIIILQQLHNKDISSMQEFSLEKGRQVQWDPGIEFILYELLWLSNGTGYVLMHLLAVKFGTHKYTYFSDTAAIICCSPANLIQHRRNIAALLPFCQYKLLSSVVCTWDPGIGTSLTMYHWLPSLSAANEKPLSSLQTPEPATCSQVTSSSYVWDHGTILLQYTSNWLLLFTEEKEMVTLIPEQLSFWFNAMHYCKIFQKYIAMSSWLYWHEDIKFNGIALWLINFNPP